MQMTSTQNTEGHMAQWHDHFVNLFTMYNEEFSTSEKAMYLGIPEDDVDEYLKLAAVEVQKKEYTNQMNLEEETDSTMLVFFGRSNSVKHHSCPDLRSEFG